MFFFPILTYLTFNTGIPRQLTKTQVDSKHKVRNPWISQHPAEIFFLSQDDIFDGYDSTDIYGAPQFMKNMDRNKRSTSKTESKESVTCLIQTPYSAIPAVIYIA